MQWLNDFMRELQGPAQQHTLVVCLIVLAVIAVRMGTTNRLLHQESVKLLTRYETHRGSRETSRLELFFGISTNLGERLPLRERDA